MNINNLNKLVEESLTSTANYLPDVDLLARMANELSNPPSNGLPVTTASPSLSQPIEPVALTVPTFDTHSPQDRSPVWSYPSTVPNPFGDEFKAFLSSNKNTAPTHLSGPDANSSARPGDHHFIFLMKS